MLDYATRVAMASHPGGPFAVEATNRYVRWGVSPRAVQALTLGAKLRALLDAEGITPEDIITKLLKTVTEPSEADYAQKSEPE